MSDFKLPFRAMGFSGPFGVGKTLAGLDLMTIAKAAGVPQDQLLVIDTHGSVEPYIMLDQYKDCFLYEIAMTQKELVDTIKKHKKGVKERGQKMVLTMIDTVELLQDAKVTEVWEDPSLTDNYKEKMTGFMWGRVKKNLLSDVLELLVQLSVSMLFTIHSRKEFIGNKPSGREESKFLAPFMQLCQAVGMMNRRLNIKLPDVSFFPPMGKSQFPALPPTIQEFTWPKFFSYLGKAPADWSKLKKEEMVTDGLEILGKLAALSGPGADEQSE